MTLSIELVKTSKVDGILKVNLKARDYQPKVDEKIKSYRQRMRLRGFRNGKVPLDYVKKMYGEHVLNEALQQTLSQGIEGYIKSHNLPIVGAPILNTQSLPRLQEPLGETLIFEYTIGWLANFSLDKVSELKIDRYILEVNDATLEESIENIQYRYGNTSHPTQVQDKDLLVGKLTRSDGTVCDNIVLATKEMRQRTKKDYLGAKIGAVFPVRLNKMFKDNCPTYVLNRLKEKGWDEKTRDLSFELNTIDRLEKAALNQHLFDKTFGPEQVHDLSAFREKVRQVVQKNYARESAQFLQETLKLTLLEKLSFSLPEHYLKAQWKRQQKQTQKKEHNETESAKEHKEYARYLRAFRWSIIVDEVLKAQNIKISTQEVLNEGQKLVMQKLQISRVSEEMKEKFDEIVQNFLNMDEGKHAFNIQHQLREKAVLNWLSTKVRIKDRNVSREKFEKLVKKHNESWS